MLTKYQAKMFNEKPETPETWQYYFMDKGLYFFQKKIDDNKWVAIKVSESDLLDGSYKFMFEHGISR